VEAFGGAASGRPIESDESTSVAGKPPLLVAVADLALDKAKAFAAKHGIPRAYESADAMLDAGKPDFVDIATRPETHLPLTKLAAQRGSASGFIHGDRSTGPLAAPVAMGSMTIEGERATLRITGDGCLFLCKAGGAAEEKLPFTPPTTGYKGDSVLATQAHLLDCLITGRPSESDGREYLKTVALVEDCYRLAPAPASSQL
jgi:predicted dehydrogenase